MSDVSAQRHVIRMVAPGRLAVRTSYSKAVPAEISGTGIRTHLALLRFRRTNDGAIKPIGFTLQPAAPRANVLRSAYEAL